jgi:hypothetical protein
MYQRNYAPSTSFNNPQTKPFQIITIAEDARSKIKKLRDLMVQHQMCVKHLYMT